ncbi:hypothetical protein [Pseudomonas phage vB_PaeM_PS119XW]|uniref:Uncharacterized protein n=1 Tax=Pseudomonas phage vB_PaeM_PS119XW TaxID=2601632 RepID=A0A5C1K869_9CAUD|nr:hypothetical protein PP933_gp260 [Pseudomonas phage vB_PaeM_PS119XW]QEM41989.1 hypothetical protein [Pseudomonas phage vB_PaeM_PS119XW]
MSTRLNSVFVDLEYYFRGTYSERFKSLRKNGIEALEFTDVDIESIINGDTQKDADTLKFYKETWLEKPRHVCFTIFEKQRNRVLVELHVELDKKRIYWKKPITRWNMPNFKLRLKIVQDTSKRNWSGSEQL